MINCLFDANAAVKYYFPTEDPHKLVKYLVESPKVISNITTVQITEVLSMFYKFHRKKIITSDSELTMYVDTFLKDIAPNDPKFNRYDFVEEHIKDLEVYKVISETCPPADRRETEYLPECGGVVKKLKNVANTADALMLIIMREIHLITDKNCYLITSDSHVKKIAEKLGLKFIDPNTTPLATVPFDVDRRAFKRKNHNLGAICKYRNSADTLMSTSTINICEGGACVRSTGKVIEPKSRVSIYLYDFSDKTNREEQHAEVIYSDKDKMRVKFIEPIVINRLINN